MTAQPRVIKLTDDLAFGAQPSENELKSLAQDGIKSVINMRETHEKGESVVLNLNILIIFLNYFLGSEFQISPSVIRSLLTVCTAGFIADEQNLVESQGLKYDLVPIRVRDNQHC